MRKILASNDAKNDFLTGKTERLDTALKMRLRLNPPEQQATKKAYQQNR